MPVKHQKFAKMKRKHVQNRPNLKKYKLNAVKIAKHFGYKSPNAFRTSSAYHRILDGIESLLEEIESKTF